MAKKPALPDPTQMTNDELFRAFVRHLQHNTGYVHHFGAEILERMDEGMKARRRD